LIRAASSQHSDRERERERERERGRQTERQYELYLMADNQQQLKPTYRLHSIWQLCCMRLCCCCHWNTFCYAYLSFYFICI